MDILNSDRAEYTAAKTQLNDLNLCPPNNSFDACGSYVDLINRYETCQNDLVTWKAECSTGIPVVHCYNTTTNTTLDDIYCSHENKPTLDPTRCQALDQDYPSQIILLPEISDLERSTLSDSAEATNSLWLSRNISGTYSLDPTLPEMSK